MRHDADETIMLTCDVTHVSVKAEEGAVVTALPVDEPIERADGFAGVFPGHKYEIVKCLQARKHICGMTGGGVNDKPALRKADLGSCCRCY